MLLAGARLAFAAMLDPEDSVLVARFHDERELCLQLLSASRKPKHLVRFLRQQLQFREDAPQRLHNGVVIVTVLFQKLFARLKGKASIALRQQAKEKAGAFAQSRQ